MKIRKIQDTINNYGAAEHYIEFKADFERFLKRKFGLTGIKEVDPDKIVKTFNLKGIVFGNYVTQEERFFFLFKIQKQLETLAQLKGSKDLGKGVLIIAFGAEGVPVFNAHYDPSKQLINLNRGRKGDYKDVLKGEGSIIHEYGHFIDFTEGRKDMLISTNFSSDRSGNEFTGSKQTKLIAKLTNILAEDSSYMSNIVQSEYLRRRREIFARLFEAAITHHVHEGTNQYAAQYFDRHYLGSIYYPKKKILDKKINTHIIKVLKSF